MGGEIGFRPAAASTKARSAPAGESTVCVCDTVSEREDKETDTYIYTHTTHILSHIHTQAADRQRV